MDYMTEPEDLLRNCLYEQQEDNNSLEKVFSSASTESISLLSPSSAYVHTPNLQSTPQPSKAMDIDYRRSQKVLSTDSRTSSALGGLELSKMIREWIDKQPDGSLKSTQLKRTLSEASAVGSSKAFVHSHASGTITDTDIQFAKSKLVDMLYGDKKLDTVCHKLLSFLCEQLNAQAGGVYLNENMNLKDWSLHSVFPCFDTFAKQFCFNKDYLLILQATLQRHCFCTRNSKSGNWNMFLPILTEGDANNGIGVIVLTLHSELRDNNSAVKFLEHMGRIISVALSSILLEQTNAQLKQKVAQLTKEKEKLQGLLNMLSISPSDDDKQMQQMQQIL